ncbi:MAG: ABC transporter ATP-binding protein [Candidatus Omnitrophica bacterium]|nr:ABC transporter ATP-binding protein [Candidatus Omnitrophota bacterium]
MKPHYLFSILRCYRRGFFLGFLSLIVVNLLVLAVPMLTKWAVDAIGAARPPGEILPITLAIILAGAFMVLFRYQWRTKIFNTARHVERHMRDDFFAHLFRLPQEFFDRTRTGDLLAIAMNDLGAIRTFVGAGVLSAFDALLIICLSLVMMAVLDRQLTLWIMIPLPFISWSAWAMGRRIHRLHDRIQSLYGDLAARVTEDINGIRVIKSFAREDARRKKFHRLCDEYFGANMEASGLQAVFRPFMRFLGGLALTILLYRGGLDVIQGRISFGTFVAFTGYVGLLSGPLMAIGWFLSLYERARVSWGRVRSVLGLPEQERAERGAVKRDRHSKSAAGLKVQNLTYTYKGSTQPALRDVSFSVPVGKSLAVVGPVGSGKSTLLHLALRIYDPPEGTMYVGEKDVRLFEMSGLRDEFAFVPQDSFIFSATLKENLAFGKSDLKDAEAGEFVARVGMGHEVEGFDKGVHTLIGERGITLSGGQRQRLSLARALAKEAPILLLDDPFSSVDVRTEKEILDRLFEKRDGRTLLLVSQRIEAVRRADLILVLDEGRVVGEGDHLSLMRDSRLYRDLFERQLLHEGVPGHVR